MRVVLEIFDSPTPCKDCKDSIFTFYEYVSTNLIVWSNNLSDMNAHMA